MATDDIGLKLPCQTRDTVRLPRIGADFSGGSITSDVDVHLAGLAESGMNLFDRFSNQLRETHNPKPVVHSCRCMIGQRVLRLLIGYEASDHHDELRRDPATQWRFLNDSASFT